MGTTATAMTIQHGRTTPFPLSSLIKASNIHLKTFSSLSTGKHPSLQGTASEGDKQKQILYPTWSYTVVL
jgi:hypothetical protein